MIADTYTGNTKCQRRLLSVVELQRDGVREEPVAYAARVASLDLHWQPFLLLLGLHVPVLSKPCVSGSLDLVIRCTLLKASWF